MPDVGRHHVHDVVAQGARVIELERRDADALLPDLGRPRVVGAVSGPADVALVRAVDGPEGQAIAHEDGQEHRQVGQVIAAMVGIIEQEHVPGPDTPGEIVADGGDGPGEGPDMNGHVLGLGGEAALAVEDRRREVAARVQDLRVGRPQHGLAHLLDDGFETVLDDGDGDSVERHDASR